LSLQKNSGSFLEENVFLDCEFEGGLINIDTRYETKFGVFSLDDIIFIGNKGGILIVEEIDRDSEVDIDFKRCYFENNSVTSNGAIVYSVFNKTRSYVKFQNCTFYNNVSKNGI